MGSNQKKFFMSYKSFKSFALLILAITSFRSAVADWNDVPTGSMKPTILEGDRVFVNKLAYNLKIPFTSLAVADFAIPDRGDVIVFFSPSDSKRLIKRVVGLPGDSLALENNVLYINDRQIEYDPNAELVSHDFFDEVKFPYQLRTEHLGGRPHPVLVQDQVGSRKSFGPVVVPNDHVFVMGDNRDDSLDSRWFGMVPMSQISGKAIGIALSVDPNQSYRPRLARFFEKLP